MAVVWMIQATAIDREREGRLSPSIAKCGHDTK